MISFKRPTESTILSLLDSLKAAPFNYDAVGCTLRATPTGFVRDEAAFKVGVGERAWIRACGAIRRWDMFPASMAATLRQPADSIEPGTMVAVICKAAGLWTVNPSRVLSKFDSYTRGRHSFGFTYGTLPGHVACGEESFRVEWDTATDVVSYHIIAVSRPNHVLSWLGYPYTRMMQGRFRRLSGESIAARVQDPEANALTDPEPILVSA